MIIEIVFPAAFKQFLQFDSLLYHTLLIITSRLQVYLTVGANRGLFAFGRFAISKIVFCGSTKVFEEALHAVKFLGLLKKFGQAQNILGPVKGQGISLLYFWPNP